MLRPLLALTAILLAGPALAAEGGAGAQVPEPPPGELLDRVVAIVNNGIVTQSELDERVALTMSELRKRNIRPPPDDDVRRQVLNQLITEEVQLQRAERIGIEITDEAVNRRLNQIAADNGLTLAQLPEVMAREGVNYTLFRDDLRKDLARRAVVQKEVYTRVNITPRELDQFIERLKKMPDETTEYNYSHILIALPSGATQEQLAEASKRADEIYERAKTENFSPLAITYSNSQTALEGGQMGWVPGPELPTFLSETIVALKPGEVARPVSDANGFHIVKLNERRSAEGDPVKEQTHARHILMTPNTLQDDATVRLRLSGIRERVLAGEDFAVFASSLSEDTASAVNGGDLDWLSPGEVEAPFEAAMSQLKDGEISEPFQTQYGWHIVQVLGRRQFDTTEDALRQRAFMQLRESKAAHDLELWLRRLRDEAFIDTDLN